MIIKANCGLNFCSRITVINCFALDLTTWNSSESLQQITKNQNSSFNPTPNF